MILNRHSSSPLEWQKIIAHEGEKGSGRGKLLDMSEETPSSSEHTETRVIIDVELLLKDQWECIAAEIAPCSRIVQKTNTAETESSICAYRCSDPLNEVS